MHNVHSPRTTAEEKSGKQVGLSYYKQKWHDLNYKIDQYLADFSYRVNHQIEKYLVSLGLLEEQNPQKSYLVPKPVTPIPIPKQQKLDENPIQDTRLNNARGLQQKQYNTQVLSHKVGQSGLLVGAKVCENRAQRNPYQITKNI